LSGGKFALQNHFADPHQSPCLLVVHRATVLFAWPAAYSPAVYRRADHSAKVSAV